MDARSRSTTARRRATAAALIVGLVGALGFAPGAPAASTDGDAREPRIEVVSNRADLVSAGDVRVAIDLPLDTEASAVTATLDGRDVSGDFAWRANGRFEALLEGLALGDNRLQVTVDGGGQDAVTIRNHPNGGPVFSGPLVEPWVCQPTAVDASCNEAPSYELVYRDRLGRFHPYDPASPPSSIATTTTDEGVTVPFIVRVETGYQLRDQYRIAVLHDPTREWEPWEPQEQWNHKLLITHGFSCGIEHRAAEAPDVLDATALGRGFMVMSTALNNAGHNCNVVTQAESLVMAKERIVERYGDLRYTIGTGCSGGSLTQHQVANAYPGIYQGLLPQCSFPDAWSTGQQLVDYNLVRAYVEDPTRWAPGVLWGPLSIAAVEDHPVHVNSIILDSLYWEALGNPTAACGAGVSDEQRYHPEHHPEGVRCALMDYTINVLGPRAPERWQDVERELGRGFAGIPLDNVGVQYGLEPLRRRQITPAQFVDLNVKIGGKDNDTQPTPERFAADEPALRRSYVSGGVNSANNLDQVAIIDLRGIDPGVFHDAYRSWAVRARLEREHGHFHNHVIWVGLVPLIGDLTYADQGLLAMDRWLAAVEADDRTDVPLPQRIVDNRPADLQDRCSQIPGLELLDLPLIGRVCELDLVQTRFGTPRTAAGSGIETDVQKCTLQPHRRQDYDPITFTDAQWEQLDAVFPDGVCDYTQRGVSQTGAVPWRTYQDDAGEVIYGGHSLGPAPAGSGGGWTSPAFAHWRTAEGTNVDPADLGRVPAVGDDRHDDGAAGDGGDRVGDDDGDAEGGDDGGHGDDAGGTEDGQERSTDRLSCRETAADRFPDDGRALVGCLVDLGLLQGYPDGTFGPTRAVTRRHLVTVLARALDQLGALPGADEEPPADRLVAAGILRGTTAGDLQLDAAVSRGQYASLLTRALDHAEVSLATGASPRFDDLRGGVHDDAVRRLGGSAVLVGYPDGSARPGAGLSRRQLATVLWRVVELVEEQRPGAWS